MSFLNKIEKILTEINSQHEDKQVYVTTKNYLKKLNRTPVNPNPTEVLTFLDRHRLAILFEVYL